MVSSAKNTTGAFPTYYRSGSPVGVQTGNPGETCVDTSTNPQTQWYMNQLSVWTKLGTPGAGGISSVVGGTDIGVDDTDPENPVINFGGTLVGQVLMLSYYDGEGESDPFPVQVFGAPAGYTPGEGIASLGAQLIVGDDVGIPSGVLLDANTDPIPDGWTFTAFIFVGGSTIYDIIAINTWNGTANGGVLVWPSNGGTPIPLSVPGGIDIPTGDLTVDTGAFGVAGATILDGTVTMSSLPTSDPAAAGQLWNNLGIMTISAG